MAYFKLVILLWLSVPQVFMPLVHAHVGGERAPVALHLPGLERYYHAGDPGLSQSTPLPSWEGAIVCCDDGVRREPATAPPLHAILPPPLPPIIGPLPSPLQQAPSSTPPLRSCLSLPLPRAPPV